MNRTPNQIAAIQTAAKSACVDAGAGSGKTSVLIDRILHLIEHQEAGLDEIVAITFTDKAAAEMKIRLRKAFRDKAPLDNAAEMSRWRDLERRVETARISTIHAFCAALLRENALRIGIDPDFTVLAEAEAILLRNEIVTESLHELLEKGDEAAMRAATEFGPQRLIDALERLLGKRVWIERARAEHPMTDPQTLARHWRQLVEIQQRKCLLAAAGNTKLRRFRQRLASFDGACGNPKDGRELARITMMEALDQISDSKDPDRIAALLQEIASMEFTATGKKNWISEQVFTELRGLQEGLRDLAGSYAPMPANEVTELRSAQVTCDVLATFERVGAAFQQAKEARTAMDFDDLIGGTLAMLRDNAEVRRRTQRGIKFLLIDEFQDTDSTQLEIARLLSSPEDGPRLFVVGDAKQSIYDFRGAEVEVFQQEKEAAEEVIPLAINFRTLPDILAFVNEFFERSALLHAVEPAYRPLETHRHQAAEPRIEFLVPPESPGACTDDYRVAEAELIAGRIDAMCRGRDAALVYQKDGVTTRPADFGDIAVLFRSMSSVYLYEASLREREIPFNVVAGTGFYERQEVIDLRNLLMVVVDPCDEMALLGFLRGPLGAISDESLARACRKARLVQAFQANAVPDDPESAEAWMAARVLIADLRARRELPLPALLRYALDRTGYEAIVLSQFLGVQKAYNVRKVVDLADDFARTRPPNLAAFLEYLDEIAGEDTIREGDAALQPEGSGAVTLMTIHKAKGLEFPIVVIPDLARERRGPDPSAVVVHRTLGLASRITDADGEWAKPAIYSEIQADYDQRDGAQHARILYVAMTRTRDWLLLGGAPKAGRNSWLTSLDQSYQLLDRDDGEAFGGNGWRAIIHRNPPPKAARATRPRYDATLVPEGLKRRVEPVTALIPTHNTFAVSQVLEQLCLESEEDLLKRAPAANGIDALLRGNAVHRLFELWDFRGRGIQEPPPIDILLAREFPSLSAREPLARYLREAAQRLAISSLGQQLRAQTTVQKEIPFLLRLGTALLSGTIDLLLEDGTIVDYKTGAPTTETRERYEWQLRLYAAAFRALKGQPPPAALLYYVDTGEHVEVDVSPEYLDSVATKAEEAVASLRRGCQPAPP